MEKDLDKISSGEISWTDVLDKFWELLQSYLNKKVDEVEISNKEEFKTRQVLDILNQELFHQVFPTKEDGTVTRSCPKCGEEVSLKSGSWGYFVDVRLVNGPKNHLITLLNGRLTKNCQRNRPASRLRKYDFC